MNFKEYETWFTSIFGPEVTNVILDLKNECIRDDETKLKQFFEGYERIEEISDKQNGYIIKGCNKCIFNGLLVRKQDTPGFLGKLNEIKYILVGLETNIPKNKDFDIHVAFDQYKNTKKVHPLFANLKTFFPEVKEKAYVTDIAKCRSTNLHQSRQICLKTHFFGEIKIIIDNNPDVSFILQGTSVEQYLKKSLKPFISDEKDVIKSNKTDKYLFKRKYLLFENKLIPTLVFPHAAPHTYELWNEIKEEEVTSKIRSKLKEFKFE